MTHLQPIDYVEAVLVSRTTVNVKQLVPRVPSNQCITRVGDAGRYPICGIHIWSVIASWCHIGSLGVGRLRNQHLLLPYALSRPAVASPWGADVAFALLHHEGN